MIGSELPNLTSTHHAHGTLELECGGGRHALVARLRALDLRLLFGVLLLRLDLLLTASHDLGELQESNKLLATHVGDEAENNNT